MNAGRCAHTMLSCDTVVTSDMWDCVTGDLVQYSVVDLARTSQAGLQIASLSGHPGNGSVRILPNVRIRIGKH